MGLRRAEAGRTLCLATSPARVPGSWAHSPAAVRAAAVSSGLFCRLHTAPALRKAAPPALLTLRHLDSDEHHALARAWLDGFVPQDVPKEAYEVSYARSSGPGGQHVNKTNSKAVVHCDVHRAKGKWLPPFVVPELQKTSYYHAPNLLFTSQATRSAPKNLDAALANMHETIVKAGRALVRGETSPEQRQRVAELAKADQARRRMMKEKQKSKKANRKADY